MPYKDSCQAYSQLLPSFTLMAGTQKYSAPWASLPSLKAQAKASQLSENNYLQTLMTWADLQDENTILHCLAHLPSLEKQSFHSSSPTTAFFDETPSPYKKRVTLVSPPSTKKSHSWAPHTWASHTWVTNLPTPFGTCQALGYDDVITETSYVHPSPTLSSPHINIDTLFDIQSLTPIKIADTGTPFDKKIRKQLLALPTGSTTSYGQLGAPRAVGGAMRRNPYIFIVPCHRVLGHNFSLAGYSGGNDPKSLARKVAIILWERLQLYKEDL